MALRKKKVPYVSPLEQAHQGVNEAFAAFITAQEQLVNATLVFDQTKADNDAYIASLQAHNEQLTAEAERTSRVANKIGELIA